MKKSLFKRTSLLVPAAILLLGSATSCNEKTKEQDEIAVTVSTVAVKSFTLKADSKILSDLDSVFFSIDLDQGVIFNADSLPVGTDVSRLIPVITFMTTVSKAEIVVSEEGKDDKTFDYLTNASDSIDFTKTVKLNVTAYDEETKYTYDLKVNVHSQKPDSLMWDRLAVARIPSRNAAPAEQHTVLQGSEAVALIKEADGSYTVSRSSDLFKGEWTKTEAALGFTPDLASFAATPDAFWVLDEEGNLMTSADALSWEPTGEKWLTVIGPYLDSVLGVKLEGDTPSYCHYPADPAISDPAWQADFPMSGRSALVSIETEWAEIPTAFFVGGVNPDGSLSGATWAFDGSVWTTIDDIPVPPVESPVVVSYVNNRRQSDIFHPYDADAWLLIGGRKADGSFNDTVYYSYDNGITWRPGTSLMQLPDYIPHVAGADGIVMATPLSADLTDYWTSTPATRAGRWLKPEYTIDGYDITWQCPYIYLIGGYTADGRLSDSIWRGVMAKLAFTPLI